MCRVDVEEQFYLMVRSRQCVARGSVKMFWEEVCAVEFPPPSHPEGEAALVLCLLLKPKEGLLRD